MHHYVYVLRSLKDGKRYVGRTMNVDRRISQHNKGLVKSTGRRRPLQLIYTEEFDSKEGSLERERFLKSGKGRDFLKSIGL